VQSGDALASARRPGLAGDEGVEHRGRLVLRARQQVAVLVERDAKGERGDLRAGS
jgi:hypothetical protein